MSDDQVGCDWVSVSSGTSLPGLSQTKAVKRLCACVCVFYFIHLQSKAKLYLSSILAQTVKMFK